MHLIVDPVVMSPPVAGSEQDWISHVEELTQLLSEDCLEGSCPRRARDPVWERWFDAALPPFRPPFSREDLVRIIQELDGRLLEDLVPPEGDVIVGGVQLDPEYVQASLPEPAQEEFRVHLGVAGVAKQDGVEPMNIVSPTESWTADEDDVLVLGRIDMRDDPINGGDVPPDEKAGIRAYLGRMHTGRQVMQRLSENPCWLIQSPDFGVRVVWVGRFDGDPGELSFELGPEFAESTIRMGYSQDRRYAAACLRTMAKIAAGKDSEIQGHIERQGSGGNNPPVTDDDGNRVQRSYLASNSPDAHRLFWIKRNPPVFLNVGGHESHPCL